MVARTNGHHTAQQGHVGLIIDNWCNPSLLRAVAADWPGVDWPYWHRYDDGKLATKDPDRLPASAQAVVRQMLNLPIASLIGAQDAFPDFNLHGAGMHCHPRGSRLGVHCDAETHPLTGWTRVASAILYAEPDWNPDWGGELEFWRDPESGATAKVAPLFNRLVIFKTPNAYHGMPSPVRCPKGHSRKSLAVFFWKRSTGHQGEMQSRFVN